MNQQIERLNKSPYSDIDDDSLLDPDFDYEAEKDNWSESESNKNSYGNDLHDKLVSETRVATEKKEKKVFTSQQKTVQQGRKKVYNKVNHCKFCGVAIKSKISRHFVERAQGSSVRYANKTPTKKKSVENGFVATAC